MKKIIHQSEQAIPGRRPQKIVIKHSEMANPYKSLYVSQWKQEILKTATKKRFILSHALVQKIYENAKKLFQGAVYKNNFYFYHDASSMMTLHLCRDFMTKSGIISHWILPENNLSKNIIYAN